MTPKRKYLRQHDQSVTITIEGGAGVGKPFIGQKLAEIFKNDGLIVELSEETTPYTDTLLVRSRNLGEERAWYLASLDQSQRQCLDGHLAALGFTL